jgi:hypothetical protein
MAVTTSCSLLILSVSPLTPFQHPVFLTIQSFAVSEKDDSRHSTRELFFRVLGSRYDPAWISAAVDSADTMQILVDQKSSKISNAYFIIPA